MMVGLLFVRESPRWLAYRGRTLEALENLAYLRKESPGAWSVQEEMAEIETAIEEERAARGSTGLKEIFLGKGNFQRFIIAFFLLFFQRGKGDANQGF